MIENSALLALSEGDMRRYSWRVDFAFQKEFDSSLTFGRYDDGFNYDDNVLYEGRQDVLQEWDKYEYTNFSDRVISVNVEREDDRPSSVALAQADIILNNYDGLFTPEGDSALAEFVLPGRPVRVRLGFDNERIEQFVGLTVGMPRIDEKNATVEFHCMDFLAFIFQRDITQTTILLDKRTDEIIEHLLDAQGLDSSQYELDQGLSTIPFFYTLRGEKLGEVLRRIVKPELGRFFMDESGLILFKNRESYNNTPVLSFNSYEHISDSNIRRENDLYNVAEVTSNVRRVQPNQRYWESVETVSLTAGATVDVWADFEDPVIDVDTPSIGGLTSFFEVNTQEDGSGSSSTGVSLQSSSKFGTSYKMTYRNNTGSTLYITDIVLFCQPAKVVSTIFVREQDDDSVEKYGEQIYEIENDYFVSQSDARTFALSLLIDYGLYAGLSDLTVKGTPQLQLGDTIETEIFGNVRQSRIVKIQNQMSLRGGYRQYLRVKDNVSRPFAQYDDGSLYDDGNVYQL